MSKKNEPKNKKKSTTKATSKERERIEELEKRYRRTFHSDQGWAYQMKAYRNKLKEYKIFQSMSRKGNC
ncbi:integrase catalytic domain-containing protein, partial [Enterococcus faecium]|uniref:integrase catalytic domain-containing protein n=1 Tax=Enterococcus faecium TaxID=1352 RepID=UPI0023F91BC1